MNFYKILMAGFLLLGVGIIGKTISIIGTQTNCECTNSTENHISIPVTAIVFDENGNDRYETNLVSAVLKQGANCFTLEIEGETWRINGQCDAKSTGIRVLSYPRGTKTVLEALEQSKVRIFMHGEKRYTVFGKIE